VHLCVHVFMWLLLNGCLSNRGFLAERKIINYKDSLCVFLLLL